MSDTRWSVVERIFHEASERPPAERAAFVREACGDDELLRREVESLLDQPSQTPFLEVPAMRVAVAVAGSQAATIAGDRIGVYQVGALLGRGGMGEVYRARDTRLDRDVAIKVLPRAFTNDPDRLARFEREARVLASLNHPHIGMIHGLEDSEGVLALILELVEGDTLADRIARGPVPVRQALTWARQIADALDAAHEKGIVHRDLKPANVKITPDELVKVLDFGLARTYAADGQAGDPARSPTITSDGSVILGTAAYMSPEQARGQAVGKRADVWAFGCVLYEMLTGRVAFEQPTISDTLAAVLHNDPDWSALPGGLSASVTTLLQRCLEKDVRQRRRDMGDVRAELEDAIGRPSGVTRSSPDATVAPQRFRWMLPFLAGGLGGIVLTGAAGLWWRNALNATAPTAAARSEQITSHVGMETMPAFSPKTPEVAFVLSVNGRRQIHRQMLAGGEPLPITHDDAHHDFPRWTPDSDAIVYFRPSETDGDAGMLCEVSALGVSAPREIAPAMTGADVSHDGRLIAAFQQRPSGMVLAILERDDGAETRIIPLPTVANYETPRWSPSDGRIAFAANEGRSREFLYVVNAAGGLPERIATATDFDGLAWLPDEQGLVYASSSGSTLRYPPNFNLRSVSLRDRTERQLTVTDTSYVHPDVSPSGLLLSSRVRMRSDIFRFPSTGPPAVLSTATRITRQTAQVQTPSASPDGKQVAYLSDSGGHSNVWVAGIDGSNPLRITQETDPDVWVGLPLWSPKGDQIAHLTTRLGISTLWITNPRGDDRREVAKGTSAVWSADGRSLYYQVYGEGKPSCIYRISISGGGPELIRCDAAVPAMSSDGRTLFFAPREPAFANEIRKASPPDGPATILHRYPASQMPMYPQGNALSPDDRFLAVPLRDGVTTDVWKIPTDGSPKRRITDFGHQGILIARQVSWSPDSRWIYAAVVETDADIVLLDGLLGSAAIQVRR